MTEEITTEAALEEAPDRGIAQWAAFKHFNEINQVLIRLTKLGWSVHPDPENIGSWYIAGPPETAVVAEGLTEGNARDIVFLINELPETIEHFEDLARLWDVLVEGSPDRLDEVTAYLDTIADYQLHIAQLEGNPTPIPEVSTAKDLSFMHIGHLLDFPDAGPASLEPIVSVTSVNNDMVRITLGGLNNYIVIVPPDTPMSVRVVGTLAPTDQASSPVSED